MAYNVPIFLYDNLSYLELFPDYTCTYVDQTVVEHCTPTDFCDNDLIEKVEINWSNSTSLHNWVET